MELSPRGLARLAERMGATARNALEVAVQGGLEVDEESSPYQVAARHRTYRLRHYFPDRPRDERPAVLLVPPLMVSTEVYDVSTDTSAARILADAGAEPWVVDFGAPEREEGGLERNLADHILAVSQAVDEVREATGRDVHLGGYSQGGMFAYQAAAYRRSAGVASIVTFGSPVDVRGQIPFGVPEELAVKGMDLVVNGLLAQRYLPAWAVRNGFRLLDPAKTLRQQLDFVLQLHNREALVPRERQRRFLMQEGWVAYPGPAIRDLVEQFLAQNRMISGGFTVDGRLVTLADITCPILSFVGDVDSIAVPEAVRGIRRAAPRAEAYELSLHTGHFGMVVGSRAAEVSWPTVAQWVRWWDGLGERPELIRPMPAESETTVTEGVGQSVRAVAEVGLGVAQGVVSAITGTARTVGLLTEEALRQLPRLRRLEHVRPETRISVGLLLDEHAERRPDDTFFVFAGRGHSYAAAKRRIDNIVAGLTPAYHSSGLLNGISGAIAGGSRLALTTHFNPENFWEEVRRYGVSVVTYTWDMVQPLLDSPSSPAENDHPVRLFMGSGMPKGLWRRTVRRFAPASVLEFFASTQEDVVLVNTSGEKIGAKGRPLPGSAEVRLARCDLGTGRILTGEDGYAQRCRTGETGMLLATVEHGRAGALRGLFTADDAWLPTGALFRRDADGDYWLVDHAGSLIRTDHGPVAAVPIEDALGELDPVGQVCAYALGELPSQLVIAAVTVRRGEKLRAQDLDTALTSLGDGRPDVVRVARQIPLTTWYRPVKDALRADGVRAATARRPAWYLDRETDTYRPLDAVTAAKLGSAT